MSPLHGLCGAWRGLACGIVGAKALVGYDNERGKGDHKHFGGRETTYRFVDVDTLLADFLRDVEAMR